MNSQAPANNYDLKSDKLEQYDYTISLAHSPCEVASKLVEPLLAASEDLLIECNWLSGGGYTLNIRGTGDLRPRNTQVLYNRFARDAACGPWTIDDPSPTIIGDAYDDGSPVEYP